MPPPVFVEANVNQPPPPIGNPLGLLPSQPPLHHQHLGEEGDPFLVGVNAVIYELHHQNHSLQEQVTTIQREKNPNHLDNVQIENPRSLTDSIMNTYNTYGRKKDPTST